MVFWNGMTSPEPVGPENKRKNIVNYVKEFLCRHFSPSEFITWLYMKATCMWVIEIVFLVNNATAKANIAGILVPGVNMATLTDIDQRPSLRVSTSNCLWLPREGCLMFNSYVIREHMAKELALGSIIDYSIYTKNLKYCQLLEHIQHFDKQWIFLVSVVTASRRNINKALVFIFFGRIIYCSFSFLKR